VLQNTLPQVVYLFKLTVASSPTLTFAMKWRKAASSRVPLRHTGGIKASVYTSLYRHAEANNSHAARATPDRLPVAMQVPCRPPPLNSRTSHASLPGHSYTPTPLFLHSAGDD